jgi:type IV pilus assembly protein PilW
MVTTRKRASNGFTLVELMVAITLALVLMVFVVQMFMASVASFKVAREQALMQENGRFAVTSLRRAVASADAWGCVGNSDQVVDTRGDIPDNSPLTGDDKDPPKSDELTIRSGTTWHETTLATATDSEPLDLDDNDPVTGKTVLVSDCMHGDIVELADTASDDGTVDITAGSLNHPENQYDAGTRVTHAQNTTFSVADSHGRRCLQRKRNGDTEKLLCGIDQMHFRYGEDTDADKSPDAYRKAANVNNWSNVLAVRAAFVVQSQSGVVRSASADYDVFGNEYTATDDRARRVVTTTVPVRNRKF